MTILTGSSLFFLGEFVLEEVFDERLEHALRKQVVNLWFELFEDSPDHVVHGLSAWSRGRPFQTCSTTAA